MRHCSLFAGVDAVGIAVRALGGETVAYSEFDPSPRSKKDPRPRPYEEQYNPRILSKRLPGAGALGDVRKIDWPEAPKFEFGSGGFPCQDLSVSGPGAGLDGDRSGLYVEIIRCIGDTRPELFLVENVPRLLSLHFERLLRDLSALGYDCEWDVISAAAVGAPHLRERLWLLAYPVGGDVQPRAFGRPKRISPLSIADDGVKWPRAGLMVSGFVVELEPVAPRKTKRVDGRTYWAGVNLLDDPTGSALVPAPTKQDGAADRTGDVRYSLESMARMGELWPTPRAAWNENRGTRRSPSVENGSHGAKLAEEVAETEVDEGRERGSLNPDWVEWLMALPVGWTNVDCDDPVYRPFWDEPLPRVIKECPNRRQRLQAIGNSLVWLIPYVILSRYRERTGSLPGESVDLRVFAGAT